MVFGALLAVLFSGLVLAGSGFAGPLQPNATYTGGVAFSADAVRGDIGTDTCLVAGLCLRVDTTAANILKSPNAAPVTVRAAFLYNVTVFGLSPLSTQAILGGVPVTLSLLPGTDPTPVTLQTYRADVTSIVAALVNGAPGVTQIPVTALTTTPGSDGLALVVVFASAGLDPNQSVAILDGGQAGSAVQTTAFSLANQIDKNIPNFNAVLSLGIQFSDQEGLGHACGQNPAFAQFSTVDVNGARLTSCAGNADDGALMSGALITVGGVGDSTANPSDPSCRGGNPNCSTTDDELYGIAGFLNQGDTQVRITTANPSNDDSIFLAVLQLTTAPCTVGVNCPPTCPGPDCPPICPGPDCPPTCPGPDCPPTCPGPNCPPPCTGADCPPTRVPGPATLILLGAGLLALIAGSRFFRRR
jgi:hypothetical protein